MSASLLELLLRVAVAVIATIATALIYKASYHRCFGPTSLLLFLAAMVGVNAVWRWLLVLLGVRTDVGDWSWTLSWVQPMNAALLFVVYFALALLAAYHVRGPRP